MNNGKRMILDAFSHLLRELSTVGFLALCLGAALAGVSCSSKPSDMRSLVPADSLVYLETNDLAAALQPVIDSKSFVQAAKAKPDLSALKGVQLAVAVTGFQANEEKIDDSQSVASIKPRFVAVADTHAWNYQAVAFAENKLGQFVADRLGDVRMDKSQKLGGTWMAWSGEQDEKPVAYALVVGSLIYFGNDASAIEKCVAVSKGEGDSFLTTAKLQPAGADTLAQGFVSTDGIGQIVNLVSMKIAMDAPDEAGKGEAALTLLPAAVRDSVASISWRAAARDGGIEDTFTVATLAARNTAADPLLAAFAESVLEDVQDTTANEIADALGDAKPDAPQVSNAVRGTANRSEQDRVERSITSDLGLIGWIVSQLSGE